MVPVYGRSSGLEVYEVGIDVDITRMMTYVCPAWAV